MNDGLSARPMPRFQPFFASPATGIDGTTSAGPARGCGPVVLRPLRVAGGLAATVMTLVALIFMALLHAPACAAEPPPAAASAWASVSALRVDATIGLHDAWDHLRILPESGEPMGADAAAARLAEFAPVGRLRSNLGKQPRGVWLALPVWRDPAQPARWVLQLDYASLDLIDVYDLQPAAGGALAAPRLLGRLGDHRPAAVRPMPTRAHAITLELPPGADGTLLLMRVQTGGSMVIPVTLQTPERFVATESREQALQGLLTGIIACLLLYSLAQWVQLRDATFGWYALMLMGTGLFFAALSGMGAQHLWPEWPWMVQNAPPLFILLGVCGAFFFTLRALEVASISPRTAWAIRICGGVAALAALAFMAGLLGYEATQRIGMALGPTPLLLVLPTAWRRLRAGDHAARFVLLGWGAYALGVIVLVGVLTGHVAVNFFSLHAFQLASLLEMSMWLMVLSHRVDEIRQAAERMQRERDRLHALAQTDALTGLLNRRGLEQAVQPVIENCAPNRMMAIFLMDLDGFKAVNDTWGHDVGDALLVGVAQRLREQVRARDLVCRLGGDEFVIVAEGLPGHDVAQRLGAKLIAAVQQPFIAAGRQCRVGATVGYALAPQDGSALEGLLQRADRAMYAGKSAGKGRLERSGPASPLERVEAVEHG